MELAPIERLADPGGRMRAHGSTVERLTVCAGYFARIVAKNAQRNA